MTTSVVTLKNLERKCSLQHPGEILLRNVEKVIPYHLRFTLYNLSEGGEPLWTEQKYNSNLQKRIWLKKSMKKMIVCGTRD
jgi:hypothetical protein